MSKDTSFESLSSEEPESTSRPAHPAPPSLPPRFPGSTDAGGDLGVAEGEPGVGDALADTATDGDIAQGDSSPPPRTTWPTRGRPRTRRRIQPDSDDPRPEHTVEQRLLILDTWLRSKLSAREFAELVGVSPNSLYTWKRRFEADGPAGLSTRKRGAAPGSRLPDHTRRAILLLKQAHPDWGQDRIRDVLARTEGYGASPGAIGRVLEQEGYVVEDVPTRPHPPKAQRFERAAPNELWQTDLFTFTLKREGRRVHLVAFMDDASRFVTAFGLHASSSGALVREVFEAGIANYGAPREVLTDNGSQYHTWRGKSEFRKLCERRGIRQVVASPRRPQTLGKIERFWGTLWRECAQSAIFRGLDDARRRIALFVDHYNFQRPHQGIDGLVPADRYFAAAGEVLATLKARVAANALELAQHGEPRKPFYLTGRVGDQAISLHAEGERVVMTREDGSREEVDLGAGGQRAESGEETSLPDAITPEGSPVDLAATAEEDVDELAPPGTSRLDELLDRLEAGLDVDDDEASQDEGGQS